MGMAVISTMSNGGAAVEEASTGQPIALRQGRGTRLSFLGGGGNSRKRDSVHLANGDGSAHSESCKNSMGGEADSASEHSRRSRSKENANRRSFFRANNENVPPLPHFSGPETTITANGGGGGNGSDMHRPSKSGGGSNSSNNYNYTISSGGKTRSNGTSGEMSRGQERKGSVDNSMMSGANGSGLGEVEGGGVAKMGSVRKRLSLLKLGRKSSKANGLMLAVDEE